MARCSCAGSSCSCKVVAGGGIDVSGIGTEADPIVVTAEIRDLGPTILQFNDGATINFTAAGDGTPASPRTVTAEIIWPTTALPVPVFTTGARPAANTIGVGRMIWNSTTKKPNWSDGAAWYDAAGAAA